MHLSRAELSLASFPTLIKSYFLRSSTCVIRMIFKRGSKQLKKNVELVCFNVLTQIINLEVITVVVKILLLFSFLLFTMLYCKIPQEDNIPYHPLYITVWRWNGGHFSICQWSIISERNTLRTRAVVKHVLCFHSSRYFN